MSFFKKSKKYIYPLAILLSFVVIQLYILEVKTNALLKELTKIKVELQTQKAISEGLLNKTNELSETIDVLMIKSSSCNPPAAGITEDPPNKFYVDPINGDINNDGSLESPWSSLNDVVQSEFIMSKDWVSFPHENGESVLIDRNIGSPVKPGDTIYLMQGEHENFTIKGYYNSKPITIEAYPGHTSVIKSFKIISGSNWVFKNIVFQEDTASSIKKDKYWGPVTTYFLNITNNQIFTEQTSYRLFSYKL